MTAPPTPPDRASIRARDELRERLRSGEREIEIVAGLVARRVRLRGLSVWSLDPPRPRRPRLPRIERIVVRSYRDLVSLGLA